MSDHPHPTIDTIDTTKRDEEWHEQSLETKNPVELAAEYVPGSDAEKRLVRKIDKRILPTIWGLYTLSYLDRANIGNAKTGGLEEDFNLTSQQYSIVLLVFFISYVLFEIPSNLFIARARPSIYLSGLCIIWGGVAAAMAAATNWKALAGIRFALGVIEAGFAPGVAFYLSSWYKRYELASRFSIYYTATAVSGAFSGLLAGVITANLDGAKGLEGWQWLFIIEGAASSFLGCFTWYFMPDWPSTTKFLTPEERLLASQRLAYEGLGNTAGAEGPVVGWSGYLGQFRTIPLYACAFLFILVFCWGADYYKNKPLAISIASAIGTVCFIIVTCTTHHMVQYVFLVFAFGCVYALCPLIITWVPNVISQPAEKRSVAIALVNALGNSASIYGVFLWPSTDKPRYIPGFSATTIFVFLMGVLAQVMVFLLKKYPQEVVDPEVAIRAEIEKQQAAKRTEEGL
ncbi:hypothetical protein B9479_004082 [Cryptococcus floricola]|uniref:Major facilitator superfamily (MFS) profile domain-containing protein n=1 Tax=Cryptococcus floricola TaxID=2591691 RepID=A0A5D3AWL0_9TREE|nr:hypothetical protein B9479_004082 [Cryptococcus floricola]